LPHLSKKRGQTIEIELARSFDSAKAVAVLAVSFYFPEPILLRM
jgi:hypothetical protein